MKRLFSSVLVVVFTILYVCGCSNNISKNIPFTDLDWSSTIDDAIEYHGKEASNSYDADLGDKAYVFENIDYNGEKGNITYFFADDGELVAVYFDVSLNSDSKVDELYNKYVEQYEKECGDSDYNLDGGTICGKVWYEKNTNIGVMCCKLLMKFVRLQYLNPDAVKK